MMSHLFPNFDHQADKHEAAKKENYDLDKNENFHFFLTLVENPLLFNLV
jgi:hypothetical protein